MLTPRKITLLSEFPFIEDDDIPVFHWPTFDANAGLYFIADLDEGLIKIGKAQSHRTRIKKLRYEFKKPNLKMMACFWSGMEKLAHIEFKDLRVKGEWFAPSPRLLNAIIEASQDNHPWKSKPFVRRDYITIAKPKEPIKFPWDAHLPV